MIVPFADFLPDQAAYNSGIPLVRNVLPAAESYIPVRSLQSFTNQLAGPCTGAAWARVADGTIYNFAGDATALYELDTSFQWQNVSSGLYSPTTPWRFARLGDRMIATALGEDIQYFDMGVSSAFEDLGGSPPQASAIGVVRNFVVLGNINDGVRRQSRLVWSGYQNSEQWTPSRATQSDTRDLDGEGGKIQAITSGQVGVILQENSIWLMTYSGPPNIFTLTEVETKRGTRAPASVVRVGDSVFYLATDGFYRYQIGGGSEPIGAEKVDRFFFAESDASALESVTATVIRGAPLIVWGYRTSSSLKWNDRLIAYNWVTKKWGYAELETQILTEYVTEGYDLDSLDTILPGGIDANSIPVDSNIYQGGQLSAAAFLTDNSMATFSGDWLPASLVTKEMGEGTNKLSVRHVRPLVDAGATITVQTGTRDRLQDNVSLGPAITPNAYGEATMRKKAKYHRFLVNISGGFNHAIGVDVSKTRVAGRK